MWNWMRPSPIRCAALCSLPSRPGWQVEYSIPFGSLTGNYLLSGQGPGWKLKLQPEGYVQASWQESYESLSINTTRYTAELSLSVTVNMILDGRSETLTVREALPMLTLLLQGESPRAYASVLD